MKFKKCVLGLVAVFALVLAPMATLGAVTVYPESGSVFGVGALLSTQVIGTNVFKLNAGNSTTASSTNLAATVTRAIDVSGANSFQVWVRGVQSHVSGATNNGAVTMTFHASPDGVIYGSAFVVSLPAQGTNENTAATHVYTTNILADAFGAPAYVKLYSMSMTNIGATWISNCVYRVIKTKTQ
jgi:hypothetical protein